MDEESIEAYAPTTPSEVEPRAKKEPENEALQTKSSMSPSSLIESIGQDKARLLTFINIIYRDIPSIF